METNRDFKELLESFNKKNVEFILVGAYALAFHGLPRNTGDMDIWINPSVKNASLIIAALNDFGFGSLGLTEQDFTAANTVIQLGVVPSRIDTGQHGPMHGQAKNPVFMGMYLFSSWERQILSATSNAPADCATWPISKPSQNSIPRQAFKQRL